MNSFIVHIRLHNLTPLQVVDILPKIYDSIWWSDKEMEVIMLNVENCEISKIADELFEAIGDKNAKMKIERMIA